MHHINHSREDFENAGNEMERVLRPGGTLVVVDIPHMIEALAGRLEQAGLETEVRDTVLGQKMLVGRLLAGLNGKGESADGRGGNGR